MSGGTMDFGDEWAAHKAAAARSLGGSDTRLNGVGAGGAGGASGPADLKTNAAAKSAAANALSETIRPGTKKAGSHADDDSAAVVNEFTGWQTGAGLKEAHEEWERQVAHLQARLAKEQSGLQSAKRDFQYVDHEVERPLSRIAALGRDAGDHRRA
ncbi:hypothetical protein ACIRP2_23940 [Streptomyces sp. NPDC101194]|uniref:hypothetical protein n=1 Tax=Streptomyces sp. NPDC101194 TaxID=3366127 RepID=UPI003813ACF5